MGGSSEGQVRGCRRGPWQERERQGEAEGPKNRDTDREHGEESEGQEGREQEQEPCNAEVCKGVP